MKNFIHPCLLSIFLLVCLTNVEKVECKIRDKSKVIPEFEKRQEYSGFKVYKIRATSKEQYGALQELMDEENGLDFWSKDEEAEVMVPQNQESQFTKFLNSFAVNYTVVIEDIERMVRDQYAKLVRSRERPMSWTEYHYPETIFSFLQTLPTKFRSTTNNSTIIQVNTTSIGETVEGRPILLTKISSNGGGEKRSDGSSNKVGVFLDGGIHAREWISPAVATYIVNQLAHNFSAYEDLLERFDFYFVPLLNPDGYAHSCNYNRLWRKTRKANDIFFGLIGCRGVDLNRNFGFSWGGKGSGRQPCSLIYAGPQEFSEPESIAVRDFVQGIMMGREDGVGIGAYFSLHSFGQKWLTPWGYTTSLPEDYVEIERVAKVGAAALTKVHGTRYSVGSTSNTLYTASGSSMDWFKGHVKTKYAYTLELRDYGLFGFLLPAYQIVPTAEETWAGIQAALREMKF